MDPESVVLDISSDEEEVGCGVDENRGVNGEDDYGWISELLDEVDRQTAENDDNNDDDDVVVVVDEKDVLNINSKQRVKPCVKDLDDDCMILDGDPDKPVEIDNNPAEDESDELLVVSEKGQVACRDYPHARHLCAKFPFSSSSHESHCDQCHCYVCDCRVPCLHWGTGISVIDHCHATDKDEYWVLQRRSSKKGEIQSPKPILKSPIDISLSTIQSQINQVPPSIIVEPTYINPVYRPTSVRPNPTFTHPNIISPNSNNHRTNGYVVPRNRFQTNLVLQNRPNGYNSFNPRDRRNGVGNISPHSISQRPVFKRSGSFGSSTTNRHVYSSSNNAYGAQFSQNPSLPVLPLVEQNLYWTNSSSGFTNQPQVPSHPNYLGPPHQPQGSSLPSVVGCYVSTVSLDSNTGPAYGNLQIPSEPYVSGGFENSVPSQSQVYNQQPVSVSNDRRNVLHQESQTHGVGRVYPSLPEFDIGWVNPRSSQMTQTTVSENPTVLEGATQTDEHSAPVEYDELFPNLDPDSLPFDSWIVNSQADLGSDLIVPASDLGPINADHFFDF